MCNFWKRLCTLSWVQVLSWITHSGKRQQPPHKQLLGEAHRGRNWGLMSTAKWESLDSTSQVFRGCQTREKLDYNLRRDAENKLPNWILGQEITNVSSFKLFNFEMICTTQAFWIIISFTSYLHREEFSYKYGKNLKTQTKTPNNRSFLAVQWLGPSLLTVRILCLIPGWETNILWSHIVWPEQNMATLMCCEVQSCTSNR